VGDVFSSSSAHSVKGGAGFTPSYVIREQRVLIFSGRESKFVVGKGKKKAVGVVAKSRGGRGLPGGAIQLKKKDRGGKDIPSVEAVAR